MVVMKHCVRLPRKPRLHFYPGVVHEAEVVDIHQLCHIHQPMDGEQEEGNDEESVVEH